MRIEAVLLDMDGVITDTAEAHAAAWKRSFDDFLASRCPRAGEDLRPFDAVADYRRLVDGRPRHDGVRSFLAARGIALPEGDPSDPRERATVAALARRKNACFEAWLQENPVLAFPSTLALLEDLRRQAVSCAAFTASRHGDAVLRRAGIAERFDALVTGEDMAVLGLPGKPHPAILLEAARRLAVPPDAAAVVEDAVAGIEAAVAGGFAQVVALDRAGEGAAHEAAGADLVVQDLAELEFAPEGGFRRKTSGEER